jgi:2-polyprenyl-6-methoxyphenol hydroxylase-like FAD-dependent oxidoreductase
VLLLGDAAHCLTLISGQGAGMALSSAAILADALGRAAVPEALAEHEVRLRYVVVVLVDAYNAIRRGGDHVFNRHSIRSIRNKRNAITLRIKYHVYYRSIIWR